MEEGKVDNQNETVTNENSNNFKEVKVYQEVEPIKEVVRTDSYFDGSLIELIGWRLLAFLIIGITLGIATPWAQCMLYSYQIKHTVYNGKRLKFEGTGGDLFINMFKWFLLTIITLGIYSLFIPVKKTRWVISNIHFEDEEFKKNESFFDGKTIQLIGVNLLCKLLNVISFGLLSAFTYCFKLRWINKHTIINRKKLVFTGKAINLFGKYILWTFLTIITFGIFGLWIPIKKLKWQTKNIHIKTVGEEEVKDKSWLIAIPILLIVVIVIGAVGPALISNVELRENQNILSIFGIKENSKKQKQDVQMIMSEASNAKTTSKTKNTTSSSKKSSSSTSSSSNTKSSSTTSGSSSSNTKSSSTTSSAASNSIKVGGYTVKFGTYTGYDTLYDWEEQKEIRVNIKLVLAKNSLIIDGKTKKYSISGNSIIVDGFEMFRVVGNNKIQEMAQSCPILTYQGY